MEIKSDINKSVVRRIFLSDSNKERTFQNDEDLPSLPVPELHQTLEKYLKSVEPFVSHEEYEKTEAIVGDFKNGIGRTLQDKLKKRAEQNKNWLSDWWLKYAYLINREPLVPCSNMSGLNPLNVTLWDEPSTEWRLERDALGLWIGLEYHSFLRSEKIRPHVSRKGRKLTMHQFRHHFNTTRIPKEGVDEVKCYFKTKSEGTCPQHIIVLCHGHIWLMEPFYSPDEQLTPPEIQEQFNYIQRISDGLGDGPGVGTLTCDNRETWAKNRRWLSSLSPQNEENLRLIDSSVLVYSLDESCPRDVDEACQKSLCLDPVNSWIDKSYAIQSFKSGYLCSSSDHAPYDATVSAFFTQYQFAVIKDEFKGVWSGSKDIRKVKMPKRLSFTLDDLLLQSIERIKTLSKSLRDNVTVKIKQFTIFGKSWIQEQKIHPDAFVQCALQLAYYSMYQKFAPTYETATTRMFYRGRTETLRSCTVEMADFVKAMVSNNISMNVKRAKLKRAIIRHVELMSECENGQGIDRHLMGLYILAAESGMPTPEIFTDPSYMLSGGGGNFVLSTSISGYTYLLGGVAAMVQDGYGAFYSILPDRINFYLTNFKNGKTDLEEYSSSLFRALINIHELINEPFSRL